MFYSPKFLAGMQMTIASIAVLLMLLAWPFGIYKNLYTSNHQEADVQEYVLEPGANTMMQEFIPQYGTVNSITLHLMAYGTGSGDQVILTYYDNEINEVYSISQATGQQEGEFSLTFPLSYSGYAGNPCYYGITVAESNEGLITALYAPLEDLATPESSTLLFDAFEVPDMALVADYEYAVSFGILQTILTDLAIAVMAVLVYLFMTRVYLRYHGKVLPYLDKAPLLGMAVSAMLALLGIYQVAVRRVFGGEWLDILMYVLGILLAEGMLLWVLIRLWQQIRQLQGYEMTEAQLQSSRAIYHVKATYRHGRDIMQQQYRRYIRALLMGWALYHCIMYVNAAEYHVQYVEIRQVAIWFGVFLLTFAKWQGKNLLLQGAWISLSAGYITYRILQIPEDLTDIEQSIMKLSLFVIFVWGMVAIDTFSRLRLSSLRKICIPYAILWAAFMTLMIVFRYTKTWPIMVTVGFALVYLLLLAQDEQKEMIQSVSDGIQVSFLVVVTLSLLRRPYNKWKRSRYPLWFHTPTTAGLYLALVGANQVARYYLAIRDRKKLLPYAFGELLVSGILVSYMLMNMSRTAYMGVGMAILLCTVATAISYKKKFLRIGKELAIFMAAALLCFPVVYSATRIVPSLYNDPYAFDIYLEDDQYYFISKNDPVDSEWYMDMEQFMNLWGYRIVYGNSDIQQNNDTQDADTAAQAATDLEERDVTNGRADIFRLYYGQLTWDGHELMALKDDTGQEIVHAHNAYLQVAHDFGIAAGILFLLLCAVAFIRSAIFVVSKKYQREPEYLIVFATIACYGVISMTEWTFHPCIPAGLVFMIWLALLGNKGRRLEK